MGLKNKLINPQEQILAIKISFFVLLGIFTCFFFLISLNFIYLIQAEKSGFSEDIQTFSDLTKEASFEELPFFEETNIFLKTEIKLTMDRLTEDIVVIRRDGKIQKNGFFKNTHIDSLLLRSDESGIYEKKIQSKVFLIFKYDIQESTVFFARDITHIYRFQQNLVINALLLSLLFFLVIYLVSLKLAKITLEPIQKNNSNLKEYNHYVAHELKTPLSVLKSNLELLELKSHPNLIVSSKEEIHGMEKIINGLLFLSENSLRKEKEEIELTQYLEHFIQKNYSQSSIKLQKKEKNIFLKTDSLLFDRLLKNMVENALKYSPKDTEILITVGKNYLSCENTLSYDLKLKNMDKLFDIFYQADASRNTKGHGLGLAIVKKICEAFDWKVSAEKKHKKFFIKIDF